jgi:hypothetical protein
MFNKVFWLESTERAVKTLAQFIIVLGAAGTLNVFTVDWQTNIGLALGGALLSYATSIVSAGVTKNHSPSLVDPEGVDNA